MVTTYFRPREPAVQHGYVWLRNCALLNSNLGMGAKPSKAELAAALETMYEVGPCDTPWTSALYSTTYKMWYWDYFSSMVGTNNLYRMWAGLHIRLTQPLNATKRVSALVLRTWTWLRYGPTGTVAHEIQVRLTDDRRPSDVFMLHAALRRDTPGLLIDPGPLSGGSSLPQINSGVTVTAASSASGYDLADLGVRVMPLCLSDREYVSLVRRALGRRST